ncbi:TniB family NTP-binding protein [Bacillus mycoides]|uniref:TniB family NTP-binding protein n=1 Tax=Bacillus mycoides TaxID=1405 RepID=UPI001F3892C9|nr:TniB family NTP-binding protein [Bacillus mycoides]
MENESLTMEQKINAFRKIRIMHPKMKQLIVRINALIKDSGENEIIILMGPSGVGKSTLIAELRKCIIDSSTKELESNKSKLPLVTVELVSPDNGLFNWKDFYIRTLEAMNEPLVHKKKLYKTNEELKKYTRLFPNHNPRTAPELRRSVENAFYYREPKVFIIDEAQHFNKMASGKRYADQLDTLKSLSNLTRIPQLLVGTYELKEFVNLNGQLARRTMDMHFPRYDLNIKEDFTNYIGIIQGLLGKIPLSVSEGIIEQYEFIYERTLGCVGILKDWLVRSLTVCLQEGSNIFSFEYLKNTALPINKVSKLLDEILLGESLFVEKDEKLNEVRTKLGLSSKVSVVKKDFNKNVGTRKPKRDKVGLDLIGEG